MNTAKRAAMLLVVTGAAVSATAGTAAAFGGPGHGGALAQGVAAKSPGLISGNLIQVPVDVPVNVTGNTINVIGILNPAFGNTSANL